MKRTKDTATCPTCETLFEGVTFEQDDFGAYAVLDLKSCPACAALLCACCDQFACDGCAATFCASHLVLVEDGTPQPLKCCAACASECEPLPLPFPPARETRIAAVAGKGVA